MKQEVSAGYEAPTLRHRFLGSAIWTGGSRSLLILMGLGVTAVLARLLDPADYGLLGMAMVFIGLVQQFRDLGIGQALVQRREVTPTTFSRAFTLALLFSLTLYAGCWFLAPLVAGFYGQPEISTLVRFLAVAFPVTAFQVVPLATLRRNLRLRGVAIARTIAAVLDAAVTIVLAYEGFGVWALAVGSLTNGIVFALALAWFHPWRPSFRLRGAETGSILRFGGGVTTSSFLWYLYGNADFLIIGRILGSAALGTYTMAWNLAKMPWDQIWIALSPLVLPLFSRKRDTPEGMSSTLLKLTRGLSLVTFPALTGLLVVAPEAVPVFLSAKWAAAVSPLRWLCLYGLFRSAAVLLSPVLLAAGRIRREIAFNAICAVALPSAFLLASSHGITVVAAAWACFYPLLAATILLPPALKVSGTPLRSYANALMRPALASAGMALLVLAVGWWAAWPLLPLLLVKIATGVITYAVLIRLLEGSGLLGIVGRLWKDVRVGART